MTKVSVYPADNAGCGKNRLIWPARALINQGHDVAINMPGSRDQPDRINVWAEIKDGKRVITEVKRPEADVVVLQRPATANLIVMIEALQGQGVKVVVDIDDALWAIDRGNLAWATYNDMRSPASYRHLAKALRMADRVVATTEALTNEFDGVIVPNFIPEAALEVGAEKLAEWQDRESWVVGWAATILTHPEDPSVTRGEVADWVREQEGDAIFLSVGGRVSRETRAFGFTEDEDRVLAHATGEIPGDDWFRAVAELDISLVPLVDSKFNRAKSRLKMLESAAAGCAVVASPTPDNVLAHELGIGVLAKERRWGRRLNQLQRSGIRDQAEANHAVAKTQTIEDNAWRFMEAWTEGLT